MNMYEYDPSSHLLPAKRFVHVCNFTLIARRTVEKKRNTNKKYIIISTTETDDAGCKKNTAKSSEVLSRKNMSSLKLFHYLPPSSDEIFQKETIKHFKQKVRGSSNTHL